mgnify:CR=1 FL=1
MRRFIAYLLMTLTMILCVGVAVTPTFTRMSAGREFTSGREIVYKLSDKDEPKEGVLPIESNDNAAKKAAEEITTRLNNMHVEDYTVKIQGNDTISVNFSCNDETRFNYISKYLGFNGGNFSLSGENEETRVLHDDVFKDCKAYIYRVNDIFPYVVFPVSDSEKVKTLIEAVKPSGEAEPKEAVRKAANLAAEGDEGGGEEKSPDIFLWANWVEGDSYEKYTQDKAVTGEKIIAQFYSDNIWFEHSKEESKEKELAYLCGFADENGEYDAKKLEAANEMANYLCNMFNASAFDYEVNYLFQTQSSSGVAYQSILTQPAGENLIVFGTDSYLNVSSFIFIASMVAIAVIILLVFMLFRITGFAIVANTTLTVFLGYIIFFAIGSTFNVGAIVGGIIGALASLLVGIAYVTKFKEEVYKGRPIRKANTEAGKKMNLMSIDVGVISMFLGLMLYVIGGTALQPMGLVVFFAGLVGLVMNLLVFRILMYLVTNTTSFQNKYSLFNIDENKVPNIMEEEKPSYVAPYEKTNFGKGRKPVGIIAALLTLGAIVVISVFGAMNGSPLNTAKATSNNTVVYTTIRADKVTLESEEAFKTYVLKNIEIDGKEPTLVEKDPIYMSTRAEYDYETSFTTNYHIFVVNFDSEISANAKIKYKIGNEKIDAEDLNEAFEKVVENVEGSESTGYITVETKVSAQTIYVPNQGMVALAAGISIVGAALYCALRYRPSRGIALLLSSASITAITYGAFVAARIGTYALTSVAMPIAAAVSILAALFIFNKEKDLVKEEKGKVELDRRLEVYKRALGVSAAPIIYFLAIAMFVAIDFFGIVQIKAFNGMFAGMIVAVGLTGILLLICLTPLGNAFEKLFSKIKLPERKRKSTADKNKLQAKPKTSEPEERTFIGIND